MANLRFWGQIDSPSMQEITKTAVAGQSSNKKYVWAAFGLAVIAVYLFGLTIPFVGPDESRYAEVGREMFERGDWVTPTLGGFTWFEKPALLYWLEMVSYRVFGISEFAARFGPALFGLGTVASLWVLGKNLATEHTEIRSGKADSLPVSKVSTPSIPSVPSVANDFANWLALIAASTLGIIVFSRGASFDIIITFPITAALVSFYIFDQSTQATFKAKYLPLILFYAFIGIALLAKGLIGIVFPFGIVGSYYVLSWRLPNRVFMLSLVWGLLLTMSIAAIWYLPMYERHGYKFIDEFFIQHHFQRFTSNKYQHPQPVYFFLWVLPLMTLPWLPFFFAAIGSQIRERFRRVPASPRLPFASSPLVLFSLSWLLVPLVFFSFSGSKLPGYILPAVPAAIVIAALYIYRLVQKSKRWAIAVFAIAGSTLTAIVLLLILAVPRFADTDSVRVLIEAAANRGYTTNRVLMLHTLSHNAEFYAAGRLLRDETGSQKRFWGEPEMLAEINADQGKPVLVLIPLEYLSRLTGYDKVRCEVLKDNGELAIVYVEAN